MNQILAASLIGNGYGFALHWMYDPIKIKSILENEDVFFKAPNKHHYDEAVSSFYGYPYGKAGDVTTQGMFLVWLTQALKENPHLSVEEYKQLLLAHIAPGGDYVGYIESYAKKLIVNEIMISMELEPVFEMRDDHLVGFIPYLATKALNLPLSKAKELATLFSNDEDYAHLFEWFDELLQDMTLENKSIRLKAMLDQTPLSFTSKLTAALSTKEDVSFLEEDAGTACVIPQSIPLIIRIINLATSFEEAMLMNVKYGGAISERAMMLGYCFSKMSEVPLHWVNQLNPQLQSQIQAL